LVWRWLQVDWAVARAASWVFAQTTRIGEATARTEVEPSCELRMVR
jgi:hypothetical protein